MKRKEFKYIILAVIALLIIFMCFVFYNIFFTSSRNSRYENINEYKLKNNEISKVKNKVEELENVTDIDVYIKSKIIRIFVKLESDVEFDKVKAVANGIVSCFSEKNLKYYDLEFFVESENKESTIYPQIGYKYKNGTEFSW